jgi:hypothetical protein
LLPNALAFSRRERAAQDSIKKRRDLAREAVGLQRLVRPQPMQLFCVTILFPVLLQASFSNQTLIAYPFAATLYLYSKN